MINLIHIGVGCAGPCCCPYFKAAGGELVERELVSLYIDFKTELAFKNFFRILEYRPCRVVSRLACNGERYLFRFYAIGVGENFALTIKCVAVVFKHRADIVTRIVIDVVNIICTCFTLVILDCTLERHLCILTLRICP